MHVVVVGCGPAGLALSVALAEGGAQVTAVDPAPDRVWRPRYASWLDEMAGWHLSGCEAARWGRAAFCFEDATNVVTNRPYVLWNNERLAATLWSRFRSSGGEVVEGMVTGIVDGENTTYVQLSNKAVLSADLVVDATGAGVGIPLESEDASAIRTARLFQVAVGVEVELGLDEARRGVATLMDLAQVDSRTGPPSFGYILPVARDRVFVEETVLIAQTDEPSGLFELLGLRLEERIRRTAGYRYEFRKIEGSMERCIIPMDVDVDAGPHGALPYGARAGLVHPATGYQVGYAFRRAPGLVVDVLDAWERGARGERLRALAWASLWPAEARRARALFSFGGRYLASLDAPALQRFFRAFLSSSVERDGRELWHRYLDRTATEAEVRRVMLRTFVNLSASDRLKLAFGAMSRPRSLMRGLTGVG